MPKASPPPDADMYAFDISERRDTIQAIVTETKWLVDLIALYATNTALATIATVLIQRMAHGGFSVRVFAGTATVVLFYWLLFFPSFRALNSGAEAVLLFVRSKLRIPYVLQERHVCINALWGASISTLYMMATWGMALMLSEMVKVGAAAV